MTAMRQPRPQAEQASTAPCEDRRPAYPASSELPEPQPRVRSMHEDIAVWEGCGSCGTEPYWLQIDAEMEPPPGADDQGGS